MLGVGAIVNRPTHSRLVKVRHDVVEVARNHLQEKDLLDLSKHLRCNNLNWRYLLRDDIAGSIETFPSCARLAAACSFITL